ncbi:cytochrome C oxidase subunit IV family protein [Botryobacter ruber]|uniref:cytochrome C oxidase subunit IV family protein n=1 Tax=Botryobacter ruber TaxID=2171629 RepID=UPI000E0B121C|nr:cytochrome C oxidase subunit IV family protein [Botryobacter ruber]
MAMHTDHSHDYENTGELPKPQTKAIWKTFIILVVLTAIEFVFAFMMDAGTLRNSIFIILTVFKAFFIVSEFMHLKHEAKALIWSILLPTALIAWLMVALISEGSYYFDSVVNYFN